MKKLIQLNMAVVISLTLTATAFAGEIHIPKAPPPASSSVPAPGDIPIGITGVTTGPGTNSLVTDVTLSLLQIVLSGF